LYYSIHNKPNGNQTTISHYKFYKSIKRRVIQGKCVDMMMFNIFFFLCLTSICYLYIYIHANRYLLPSTFYIPTVIFSLMASLLQMGLPLIYRNTLVKSIQRPRSFTCTIVAKTTRADESPVVLRRSANYQPSLWDHHHLLSVENKYSKDESVHDRDLLKENVRTMLNDERTTHLEQLELIDDLQKLGVSYHFEREIDNILTFTYHKDRRNFMEYDMEYDLHATALEFRLLRQHGFNVPEDVFDVFMENCGKFDSHDINGLLSLYEASYLSTKSDTKLQKNIRVFATQQLRNFVDTHGSKDLSSCDVEMVVQALDMPYHWRMGRLATRWYIDMYGKKHNKNPMLLEFSKLDFSIVQAVYQEELKYVSSWWRETGLANQLHFSRDRIVENYFWTTGQIQEPQFGKVRASLTLRTKMGVLIIV
ncbi:BnaCnng60530D, partial [Brassica napus]